MTIKLEVGKTYVTRAGEPVKILSEDGDMNYPFNGSDSSCYTPGGQYYGGGPCSLDLVSELQEPGATTALADATVAFHRQQFLDALMLELVRQGEGLTSSDIADTFKELVEARDAAA